MDSDIIGIFLVGSFICEKMNYVIVVRRMVVIEMRFLFYVNISYEFLF